MRARAAPVTSRPFAQAKGRAPLIEFTGSARLDRRTKRLVHRLGDEDIAIVDHTDLDRMTAEELLETGVPVLQPRFRDRHALVVARGPGHKRDLRIVRPYIRDFKPVLVGVDGGADALIEAGYRPDVIVGDMDSVSDTALASGAELLVHA